MVGLVTMNFPVLLELMVIVLVFVGPAPVAGAQAARDVSPLVTVEGGTIRGVSADGVIAFKGIPFAQPPLGALRWRPPQPVIPWDGVRDATEFGPNPEQPSPPAGNAMSEDCLYLNVWRPAAANGPLPVMVWIYGGGLVQGGTSVYPGQFLARKGIVFVSVDYRLGRFGFFAHPALARESPDDLRGNYGFMDQIAALKWVRRNISAFVGNPSNVTIAGESAGGGSVLVLLTSPLARGLFERAIPQSPGIPTARAGALPMRSLAGAESIAVQYARTFGIDGDGPLALIALRALPAETLCKDLDTYVLSICGGPDVPGLSHSIIDGRVVVESPETALRGGQQAMVPVIVGANSEELGISPVLANQTFFTKEAVFAQFGLLAHQARLLYDPNGSISFKELVQRVESDGLMVEPSRHLAEEMAHAGQRAYFYRFSYVPPSLRGLFTGAPHGKDVFFVFDVQSLFQKEKTAESDTEMGKTVSGYWVNFVKTGDPNGSGLVNWPRYDPAAEAVLNFSNEGVTVGPDPLRQRLDLWRKVREGER
jgi:para-nitrobenzyl esterase